MSPPSFPRTFPCSGASFPPRGPSGWFPRFPGTVRHSDFLPPFPRCFVSFASRYRRCALGFVPADARRYSCGPGVVNRAPQKPDSLAEVTGPPRFLEDPVVSVPCSPTPVGPPRSAATALRCCLPPIGKRRLPRQILISGLNHTACSLAVYASRDGLLHRHARLASGWPASLVRAGMTTRGVLPKGFRLFHPPSPGFAWRTQFTLSKGAVSQYRNHR
jgi:hypothetical protein